MGSRKRLAALTVANETSITMGGVLVVDKPSGPTSFDIVAQVRRGLCTRQVGHAGTLDPMASGVLVIMVGQATKLSDYLTAANKTYQAQVQFGRSTNTLDIVGATTACQALSAGWLTERRLASVIEVERRRAFQVPPQFSAIKQGGKKSYVQARLGQVVEHAPRPVTVHQLNVVAFSDSSLELELTVSKGYYVRSLARDLCQALGVAGCLSGLRRTASGCFDIEQACAWPVTSDSLIATADAARKALPSATLTDSGVTRAHHGKRITIEDFSQPPQTPALCAWFDSMGRIVALGEQMGQSTELPHRANVPLPDASGPEQPMEEKAGYRVVRGFTKTG